MDNHELSCIGDYYSSDYVSGEQIFRHPLKFGETITFTQTENNYDSMHELRAGVECPGEIIVNCVDEPVICFLFFFFEIFRVNFHLSRPRTENY